MKEKKNTGFRILLIVLIVLAGILLLRLPYFRGTRGMGGATKGEAKWNLVMEQIKKHYVDEVNVDSLIEKTLPALLENLDPHSIYFEPEDWSKAQNSLSGNFEGVGLVFNVPNDTAVVINAVHGGPSEKAGIQSGDRIMMVDTAHIAGVKMSQDSMVRLMRGPKDTKVRLGVMRLGEPDLVWFDIIRDKIPEKSVTAAFMLAPGTGYIKLDKFTRTSYMEVIKAMIPLFENGMERLVFDLRDNTGGYMDQALMLANEFLRKGQLIVYLQGAHRKREDFHAAKDGLFSTQPLAVLINEASASSSEILAGALQDNDRGVIVGRRSFGKGLVQEPVYFTDKSGIRLTVSRYYTPTGRCIQKPYTAGSKYDNDILERYEHGELMQADSIPHNDSLRFTTLGGKVVYGGGGIIPDVFVPLDTIGTNDMYMRIARLGLTFKFASQFADNHRRELLSIEDMPALNAFFDGQPLEKLFRQYVRQQGVSVHEEKWRRSRHIMLSHIKAYIGRNTPMGDNAFYAYLNEIDKTVETAVAELDKL